MSPFAEQYLAYKRIKDANWLWRDDDMNRAVRGKKKPGKLLSLWEMNSQSPARAYIRIMIRVYEEHMGNLEEFTSDGRLIFPGLRREYLRGRMCLGKVDHVTYFARDTQLGSVFSTGGGYRDPYWIRVNWVKLEALLQGYFGRAVVVNSNQPLSSVQSADAVAPSALKEDKDKTPHRGVIPFLGKKIRSYQDLNPETRKAFDLIQNHFQEPLERIPGKTFGRLQHYMTDPAPKRRMTLELLGTILLKLGQSPELFEQRQQSNDLEHFIQYWPTYIRVVNHETVVSRMENDEVALVESRQLPRLVKIYSKFSQVIAANYLRVSQKLDDAGLSEIAFNLAHCLGAEHLASAVGKAKAYLLEHPCVYLGAYGVIGNLPDLLGITDEQHLQLVKTARSAILRAEINSALEAHYS